MSKPAPTDFESWLRQTERRLLLLERRPKGTGGTGGGGTGSHYTAGDGLVVVDAATHANPLDPNSLGIVSVGQGVGVKVTKNAVGVDLDFLDDRYESEDTEEVVISAGVPPTKNEELWVDTSATVPVYDWSYADNRYLGSQFANVIRNGDMSIAQRGNGPFTTSAYTIDGWIQDFVGGTASTSRVIAASGELSSRAAVTVSGQSAANHYCTFSENIENVSTFSGKQVTLSFDAWSISGTPKISVEVQQYFGTGGTPSASQFTVAGVVTLSTTRTRYSLTFNIPSVAGASLGTNGNHSLGVNFWLSAGSNFASRASNIGIQNNTFNITDVQLEEGAAATKFERLPIQQQLAWCQRYFYRMGQGSAHMGAWVQYAKFCHGYVVNPTTYRFLINYPVLMRNTPTMSSSIPGYFEANNGATSIALTACDPNIGNAVDMELLASSASSGMASGQAVGLRALNVNAYLDFSAEL